jgi:hypothetical protein
MCCIARAVTRKSYESVVYHLLRLNKLLKREKDDAYFKVFY